MLDGLRWLALEVKYLDRAQSFYEAFLDLEVRSESDHEVAFAAGDTDLVLRRPHSVPRGGLHTHYALSIPRGEYDSWYERLDERFDLVEHTFGDSKSLYFYDTEVNCVELGQSDVAGPGVDGVFEVVFEVEDLDRAQALYGELGFETVDEGDDRKRVRMTAGSFDIELWEPHLGLADARGGVHVDVGIEADDPGAVVDSAREQLAAVEETERGYRLRDPDGHYLTVVEP
ncbi:fosmidomycin resistance protein [Halovenus sp. WSH3]|uniref:Fosmidomycin resistance protein n=1 Tax=Halovenus carboxidivorans TaxID=2692199 RepID=A0A6B0T269_9EURY|nr:VOC family protein [Halovenus carboxidivorans]MXR51237.1 fosmidomycin resistance protein [Halovenus carboxidivorans]